MMLENLFEFVALTGGGLFIVYRMTSRRPPPTLPRDFKLMPDSYRPPTGMPVLPHMLRLAAFNDQAALRLERYLGGAEYAGVSILEKVVATTAPTPPLPTPVTFRPGEPTRFAEYDGQQHFVPFLRAAVRSIPPSRCKLGRPQLLLGPPGLGKTLLAKVIAAEIGRELVARGRGQPDWILALGSDIETPGALDAVIRRAAAQPGNVLFIDEIHTLVNNKYMDKWLLLLDEHRWQFEGARDPERLNDFTILAATTDYGALHGAFRRRFAERQLQPLTEAQIVSVLQQRFNITPEAAALAGSRTHQGGAPWEGIALLTDAEDLMRDRGSAVIELADVQEVFRVWDIDERGLRPHDRAVLKALLTQRREVRGRTKNDPPTIIYAASEDAVVSMARVDRDAYRTDIRPRLMSRGLLLTSSRGQQLTDEAVRLYGVRP